MLDDGQRPLPVAHADVELALLVAGLQAVGRALGLLEQLLLLLLDGHVAPALLLGEDDVLAVEGEVVLRQAPHVGLHRVPGLQRGQQLGQVGDVQVLHQQVLRVGLGRHVDLLDSLVDLVSQLNVGFLGLVELLLGRFDILGGHLAGARMELGEHGVGGADGADDLGHLAVVALGLLAGPPQGFQLHQGDIAGLGLDGLWQLGDALLADVLGAVGVVLVLGVLGSRGNVVGTLHFLPVFFLGHKRKGLIGDVPLLMHDHTR